MREECFSHALCVEAWLCEWVHLWEDNWCKGEGVWGQRNLMAAGMQVLLGDVWRMLSRPSCGWRGRKGVFSEGPQPSTPTLIAFSPRALSVRVSAFCYSWSCSAQPRQGLIHSRCSVYTHWMYVHIAHWSDCLLTAALHGPQSWCLVPFTRPYQIFSKHYHLGSSLFCLDQKVQGLSELSPSHTLTLIEFIALSSQELPFPKSHCLLGYPQNRLWFLPVLLAPSSSGSPPLLNVVKPRGFLAVR